jgi:hypothetical protein
MLNINFPCENKTFTSKKWFAGCAGFEDFSNGPCAVKGHYVLHYMKFNVEDQEVITKTEDDL